MKWVILFFGLSAGTAMAQAVVVKSGDHADFTRLVLTFPDAADWQLGRSKEGYELGLGARKAAFDLTDVYRLITKARLKSVWTDPTTGRLQLGVACACHAIPFEFNRNTLVIDIKDGAPPEGSTFEQALIGGEALPPIGLNAGVAPGPVPDFAVYDWLEATAAASAPIESPLTPDIFQSNLEGAVAGDGFRNAVIDQLAKGATEGIVEIVPIGLADSSSTPSDGVANVRMGVGDLPDALAGVSVSDGKPRPALSATGDLCPVEDRVDPARWGSMDSGATALFAARASMLGEFDEPDPDGLQNAIYTLLFFGFGAEARNLMQVFQSTEKIDPLAVGLSYLVDGEAAPEKPFSGMQTCNSAAAFWALAEAEDKQNLAGLDGSAVARTYLGLPKHLKLAFAQVITQRLLQDGDAANAEIVRSALTRAAPGNAAIVPLVEATMALTAGEPEKAESYLEKVSDSAVAADALVALVEARFQMRSSVDEADVFALEAFAFESRGGKMDAVFQKALTHAKALSGDFAAAFALAGENATLRSDTWELLAAMGKDSDLLALAVGGSLQPDDRISASAQSIFVRRLMDLGLPNAAMAWLAQVPPDPVLAAEVFLANNDGRAALRALAADLPAADPSVLSEAFRETGDFVQAASVLRDEGDSEAARRLERWGGIWTAATVAVAADPLTITAAEPEIAQSGDVPDVWDDVLALRDPMPNDDNLKPLESGQKNLADSTVTRDRIANLLSAVPPVP